MPRQRENAAPFAEDIDTVVDAVKEGLETQTATAVAEPPAAAAEPEPVGNSRATGVPLNTPDAATILAKARAQRAIIGDAQRRLAYLEGRLEEAKGQVKAQEALIERLNDELLEILAPESLPLFAAANGKPADSGGGSDDLWRSEPIEQALPELSESIRTKLRDAGIDTLGELADYTADGKTQITDIAGVGPKAAEKIEEAMTAYWARRKITPAAEADDPEEPAEESEAAEETETEGDEDGENHA